MNVISNNCCGGWLYMHNKIEYSNPFIWSITQYESLLHLIEHFYDINWSNIQIDESPLRKNTFQLIVDDKVNIHYLHCLFNPAKSTPTKVFRANIGNDIDYCAIWEYVYNKYVTRIQRMIKNHEPPVFLLCPNTGNCDWSIDQINHLLNIPSPFKRILIEHNKSNCISNDNKNNLVLYTSDYPNYSKIILTHRSLINRFIGIEQ